MAMKRVTRSMKRNKSNENDSISVLPLELKAEILTKLPPKSIARLGCVSKHWSSITRAKDFTDLYLTRSPTRPRLLFSVYRGVMQTQFFHSCSQDDPTSSSDRDKVSYTLNSDQRFMFTPPIRGLICGRNGKKVVIGNPTTGHFVTLPQVKTTKKDILSVFGYDPVNDVYKVLCMTVQTKRASRDVKWEDVMSEEHQVITLGATKQKWRMVECEYLHRHESGSQGICRDGVVYYLASYNLKRSLMSFDLRSEEFNVTKLPEDDNVQQFGNLVNHTGKIIIASQANDGPIDLWVLEDAKEGKWSKAAVVVPSWEAFAENDQRFIFRGILGTGEIMLAPIPSPSPFFFLCYDLKEKNIRKVVIEGIGDDSADVKVQVFFDHVESPMFL